MSEIKFYRIRPKNGDWKNGEDTTEVVTVVDDAWFERLDLLALSRTAMRHMEDATVESLEKGLMGAIQAWEPEHRERILALWGEVKPVLAEENPRRVSALPNRIRLATVPLGHTQCNHCRTCVPDAEFPAHWEACPVRQRLGYIAPVIASPS